MTFVEYIRHALAALRAHRLRTALTLLGIVIGVSAVVAMVSIGLGARAQIEAEIGKLGSNLLMVMPNSHTSEGLSSGIGGQQGLTEADAVALRSEVLGIQYAVPSVSGGARLIFGNNNWSARIVGTLPDYLPARDWSTSSGRTFSNVEVRTSAKVLLMGKTVAERLSPGQSLLGQVVRVQGVPFRVIGILAPKGYSSVGRDQDDIIIVPITTAKSRLVGGYYQINRSAVEYILLKGSATADFEQIQSDVSRVLRHRHNIGSGRQDDFVIRDPTATLSAQREATDAMTIFLACIAAVSLVVGGISIANIMLVSVVERTREIGVRVAVGATARDILMQFLAEAACVALIGGTIGVGLGIVMAYLVEAATGWVIVIDGFVIVGALVFSATIGVCSGLYPALQASRLDPIEALRHD
jgi:putative ABC transport system permease protein